MGGIAHGPDGGEHVQREARHHRILCELDALEVVELRFGPDFEGVDPHTQGTLFRTTELFLERLGLASLEDLPPLAPLLPDIDAIDEL